MAGLGISYPPPTETVAIFDDSLFILPTSALTYNQAEQNFLAYPNAQGTENLQTTNVGGVLTCASDLVMSGKPNTNFLQFPDGTKQFTASLGIEKQFTIQSETQSTNKWTFKIPSNLAYAFNYYVYSNTTPTGIFGTGVTTLNGSFFYGTGSGVGQPISYTNTAGIFNANMFNFSVINSMGRSFTWSSTVPTGFLASNLVTYTLTLTSGSVANCYAILTGQIIAPFTGFPI